MNISKIFLSFLVIIITVILGAVYTIVNINQLTINTQKMYTHPFKVSNAVADIQTAVITMHRNMKDIVLTSDSLEMIKIIESIQKEEEKVYKNFDLIYKNYLGNKHDIDKSYKAFKQWRPIREEVFALVHQNKVKEAIAITKGKGANHIHNLYKQIKVLKDYAFNKANEFYNLSIKSNYVQKVITIFFVTLLICSIIVIYIIQSLLKIAKANNKQLHLIDQNILTSTLDLDKKVLDISNALCYALDKQKDELLYKENKYFFTTEEQYKAFESKIYSGKEHKGEVYIYINDVKAWFNLEIFPELDTNFQLKAFNIFLTNISDKKKIEEVSITDALTGLYNRNYFEMIFEKEMKRAKRDSKELCMVMFDIDYFKQYNDTYGHQEGDIALKAVAHILLAHTNRSYDYPFRIGGEEFVILTYQKNLEALENYTNTILKDIQSLKISHKTSEVSNHLTASAGVGLFAVGHLLNTDEMYKTVDSLLYEAKKEGRNRLKSNLIK